MVRFCLAMALCLGLAVPASAALLTAEIHVPNSDAPMSFSAQFDRDAVPNSGSLPLTEVDFNGSPGQLLLLVNDAFGTETLLFQSGSVEGILFNVELGDFSNGAFAGDVFINVNNPFGADFVKNVPGEITITPIPGAVALFATALAGLVAVRRRRRI